MIENIFKGSFKYWTLLTVLLAFVIAAFFAYLKQWDVGLTITGLSRDVSWGLYIANFTFFVGVAASRGDAGPSRIISTMKKNLKR